MISVSSLFLLSLLTVSLSVKAVKETSETLFILRNQQVSFTCPPIDKSVPESHSFALIVFDDQQQQLAIHTTRFQKTDLTQQITFYIKWLPEPNSTFQVTVYPPHFTSDNQTSFWCSSLADYGFGEEITRHKFDIAILDPPQMAEPSARHIQIGAAIHEEVPMLCSVANNQSAIFQEIHVVWYKGEISRKMPIEEHKILAEGNFSVEWKLRLENETDFGVYSCLAQPKLATQPRFKDLDLEKRRSLEQNLMVHHSVVVLREAPPEITCSPRVLFGPAEATVSIPIVVRGTPPANSIECRTSWSPENDVQIHEFIMPTVPPTSRVYNLKQRSPSPSSSPLSLAMEKCFPSSPGVHGNGKTPSVFKDIRIFILRRHFPTSSTNSSKMSSSPQMECYARNQRGNSSMKRMHFSEFPSVPRLVFPATVFSNFHPLHFQIYSGASALKNVTVKLVRDGENTPIVSTVTPRIVSRDELTTRNMTEEHIMSGQYGMYDVDVTSMSTTDSWYEALLLQLTPSTRYSVIIISVCNWNHFCQQTPSHEYTFQTASYNGNNSLREYPYHSQMSMALGYSSGARASVCATCADNASRTTCGGHCILWLWVLVLVLLSAAV